MTDNDFLAHVLADGEWHGQMDIVLRSQRERGCGMTVHSRISDLRVKRGFNIEQRSRRTGNGRVASFYRLVSRPVRQPYVCADCGRRFFNLGWHAEACGSSNYAALEAPVVEEEQAPQLVPAQATGASSVDAPSGLADGEAAPTSTLDSQPQLFVSPRGAYDGEAA